LVEGGLVIAQGRGQYRIAHDYLASAFVDLSSALLDPSDRDNIRYFSEGLAGVQINNKWGFINKKGEIIVEPKYDKVFNFERGLALVKINGKLGTINKSGKFMPLPKK